MTSKIPAVLEDLRRLLAEITSDEAHHRAAVRGQCGSAAVYAEETAERLPRALARMVDALPGPITTSWDTSGGGGPVIDEHGVPMPTISDPTGEAAIRADPAVNDRTRLMGAIACARMDAAAIVTGDGDPVARAQSCLNRVRDAWIIATRYASYTPTTVDRDATTPAPGCESCARDGGHWEPVSRMVRLLDGGGRMPMCSWCRDRYSRWGSLPTMAELRRNHQGRNVPDRAPR